MPPTFSIIAVMSAYNEADIIGASIDHLAAHGVGVYVLDDGSTDETLAIARSRIGRGVVGTEELAPPDPPGLPRRFSLAGILRRKEELALALDARWFIQQDADECRESPWPHMTLSAAIALVDRLGWNAIDFEVLNFVPEGSEYRAGTDPRESFRCFVPGPACDKVQVRCWKKMAERVDLVSSGGHDDSFTGRQVFPIRFPMRHYPIRGEEHGRRKVFLERRDRFDPEERAAGWHVQYDGIAEGTSATAGWGTPHEYDAEALAVDLQLRHRLVDRLLGDCGRLASERERLRAEIAALTQSLRERGEQLHGARQEVVRLTAEEAELSRRLEEVFASKSWRVTAPLRSAWRWLGGR